MKKLLLTLLCVIAFAMGYAQSVEPYTPRWRNERVYPKNFNTWYMYIGYHGSDSTVCAAPYEFYYQIEDQPCRILSWDAAPNTGGVSFARISTPSGCIVYWPWKWYSAATGATYYFLSRTP